MSYLAEEITESMDEYPDRWRVVDDKAILENAYEIKHGPFFFAYIWWPFSRYFNPIDGWRINAAIKRLQDYKAMKELKRKE